MGDDKDRARAAYDEGRQALETRRYADAVGLLEESAKLDTHFKTLEVLGEALMNLGRYKDAVVPLAASTALNRQARAPSLLAQAFLALGEECRAYEFAQVALERSPGNRVASEVLSNTKGAYERRQRLQAPEGSL